MQMSVFRQGLPTEQIDHGDCIKDAVDLEATKMILHARLNNQATIVGLRSGLVIIKPYEETDEALRFEDLFDTAVSLHDYRKMEEQKVRTREELAPHLYEMELLLVQDQPISIRVRFKARNEHDARLLVKRLVREDTQFGTELQNQYVSAMLRAEVGSIETLGPQRIAGEAPEDAPEWEILKRS